MPRLITTDKAVFLPQGTTTGNTYKSKVLGYSPIAYWVMNEASGTDAICSVDTDQNGTYTGVTLGQTGIGDGLTCPLYDGTNDYLNPYTTTFRDAWDGETGSLMLWFKMSAGAWTDGTFGYIIRFDVDGNNYVRLYKSSTNNKITAWMKAGGTGTTLNQTSYSPSGWVNVIITWNYGGDNKYRLYLDNSEVGSGQTIGQWAGGLVSNTTLVGSYDTGPSHLHAGYLAHLAHFGSVLGSSDRADLQVIP